MMNTIYVVPRVVCGGPGTGGDIWEEDRLPALPARSEDLRPEDSKLGATHRWGTVRVRQASPEEEMVRRGRYPGEAPWTLFGGRPIPAPPR